MQKLYFITSNKGKVSSLQKYLKNHCINTIDVEGKNLQIIEPQANTVKEVSKIKALSAFEKLKAPLIVEDGGFAIDVLEDFPSVYTRYILDTIGIEGVLKLMKNQTNRKCRFISTATFVDKHGEVYQFDRIGGGGEIALQSSNVESPFAWSDIWKIFYYPELGKTLSELSEEELFQQDNNSKDESSLFFFIEWLKEQKLENIF